MDTEDHIGAIPCIEKQLNIPVYATKAYHGTHRQQVKRAWAALKRIEKDFGNCKNTVT